VNRAIATALLAVGLLLSSAAGGVRADEAKPAEKKADLTPAQQLAEMEKALKISPETEDPAGVEKALTKALASILEGADAVLAHPKATDAEKLEAYQFKISSLYQGARIPVEGYAGRLDELARKLTAEKPRLEVAPLASYLAVKIRIERGRGFSPKTLVRAEEFIRDYPGDESAISLLQHIGNAADAAGDREQAKKAYGIILEKFGKHPAAKQVAGILRRIDLPGKPIEFAADTVDGGKLDSQSLKGKVVLIDFWATWCGPCVAGMPHLKKLHEKFHEQGLEIVGVPLDEDRENLDAFLLENKFPWKHLFFAEPAKPGEKPSTPPQPAREHPLAEQYGVVAIPVMFLIDRDGTVVSTNVRVDQLETKITELLAKPTQSASKAK
jgi:thiol-disulfide isomerase/thioredoxin